MGMCMGMRWGAGDEIGRWKEAVDKRGWGKPFNKGDTVKSWGLRKITRWTYTKERILSLGLKETKVDFFSMIIKNTVFKTDFKNI